ncbi:hypothetical protein [Sulfurimonas paralvinellae]|uniref:Uncharacterized protein n=1 Tax=Sulfurimonas paralvinellae TaxID=317658 RepID=A0A7M1BA32_9BACT|nr:hypothetical protein [Sulfurimonas paralvinellae]QOP45602.1 hypothetical protein FM071_04595 [Sulfurimonas paralvinellae]
MEKLAYVGPKPLISHRGIEFDKNQDDKFNYLPVLIELIKALDHDYFEDKQYTFLAHPQELTNTELMQNLSKYCPDLEDLIQKEFSKVDQHITDELKRVRESKTLDIEEKTVFENNLKIMHDYLIHFSVNQAVYTCALKKLAELVAKDHIDYINVPLFQKYAYVLHDLQAVLKDQKHPIDTQLDFIEKDEKVTARLRVINLV